MKVQQRAVRPNLRCMFRRDYPEVTDIEFLRWCKHPWISTPWTEDDFSRILRGRNSTGEVAEHNDRVIGYTVYEFHKSYIKVLNFKVNTAYENLGVRKSLIEYLMSKLSSDRYTKLVYLVNEYDKDGQIFLKDQGFRAVKTLRDFYEHSNECADAYIMKFDLVQKQNPWSPQNRISDYMETI